MKILHIVPSVDPAQGGVIAVIRQQSKAITELGHQSHVLSLDDPRSACVTQFGQPVYAMGPARGHYRFCAALVPWLTTHAQQYDAIVVHGLWQYHAFGTWRALRTQAVPYFVFPHGMLDPWFRRNYPWKHLKKWLYWPWADYRLLRGARQVLFTCEEEKRLARQSFWLYKARESVVPLACEEPPAHEDAGADAFYRLYPQLRSKRCLLFLGRIHPKKGCDLLIKAFAQIAAQQDDLHLIMAGPDQVGWQRELKSLTQSLRVDDRIVWTGMLQGSTKWAALRASEALILPSHQENFGLVLAESLATGTPTLLSNQVNIWREISSQGAGLVEPDTLEGTLQLLGRWLSLDADERRTMGKRARACYERCFSHNAVKNHVETLLRSTLLDGRTPNP